MLSAITVTGTANTNFQGLPPASPEAKTPAVVKNNTFLWAWDDRAPGAGRYSGTAIALTGPATITNNIIGFCDNNGIYMTIAPDRTTVGHRIPPRAYRFGFEFTRGSGLELIRR